MSIQITEHVSSIKTVRQSDSDFMLHDKITVCPRAGFEINASCPREYRLIIQECIQHGWLKPVAHMYDHELVWDQLSK